MDRLVDGVRFGNELLQEISVVSSVVRLKEKCTLII